MPLCKGSLTSLAQSPRLPICLDKICAMVLEQGLSALDYLANEKLIHRDIIPDNILYCESDDGNYLFKLADFGLARHHTLATTFCGTGHYQAPELWPTHSKIIASQSPKMDIWSLFASVISVHPGYPGFPPKGTGGYDRTLNLLKEAAAAAPSLEAMARLHPDRRASAAQLLVLLFDGKGLTTKRSNIHDIEPDNETAPPRSSLPSIEPGNPRQTRNGPGKASPVPVGAGAPLIVYPPRRHRPLPGPSRPLVHKPPVWANRGVQPAQPAPPRMHKDGGVAKPRAATGPNAPTRPPLGAKERLDILEQSESPFNMPGMFPQ